MNLRRGIQRQTWLGLIGFLGWSLVFGIIYAQSPLYSNNQNAYFLHGLAKAGLGYLSHDWQANLPESTPVFSWLVYLTYAVLPSKIPFYFYYALIMGIYLASMYRIMDLLFDLGRSKARRLAFVALFLAAHSAALRYFLSRGTGAENAFLLEGGVAGQRILGQVFQPSVFGVFLVLSILLFLRKRRYLSLLPMMAAIYFHPVYLLGGALLTLAYMWVIFREEHSLKPALKFGLAALLMVAPSLAYAIYIFWEPSREIAQRALDILVNIRNPHHALVSVWLDWTVAVQALILLAGLFIVRRTRLFPILVVVTLGVFVLTVAQVVSGAVWLALLFPWRVSILLVPMGTTILIAFGVTKLMDHWKDSPRATGWVTAFGLALIAGAMTIGAIRFQIDLGRQRSDPAAAMMAYVAAHKSPGEVYMIPAKMTDFRLATGAPILVDFKTAPDRDRDVLEWYRRLQAIYWFYGGSPDPCQTLKDMAAEYGITHAVVQSDDAFTLCRSMPTPYEDANYRVYAIPQK